MLVRPATRADAAAIGDLQVLSMRRLGAGCYTPAEIEAACRHVCVPDTALIDDGTYLVALDGGTLVGCGGWSLRRKAFAGPAHGHGDDGRLDPAREPTWIRAMFVHPDRPRQGIGRLVLTTAEAAAHAAGFRAARLGAMLSGEAFYRAHGYRELERQTARLVDGTPLTVVLMEKPLLP